MKLTPRELEILKHVLHGKTNAEIANTLHISPKTVKHYMTLIMRKLKVVNRTAAALLVAALVTGDDASACQTEMCARQIYGADGRLIGRSATDSQGTTTYYGADGRVQSKSSNGTLYGPDGRVIGKTDQPRSKTNER